MALVSLPVIFLHILEASAVEEGGNSLITVFKPKNRNDRINLIACRIIHFCQDSSTLKINEQDIDINEHIRSVYKGSCYIWSGGRWGVL